MLGLIWRHVPRFMSKMYVLPNQSGKQESPTKAFLLTPKTELKQGDKLIRLSFFNFFGIPLFVKTRAYTFKE